MDSPTFVKLSFGGYGSDSTDRAELTALCDRAGRPHPRAEARPAEDPRRRGTPKDIEAARAVEAVTVGVASGSYGEAELRKAGADYVLASLPEPLPGLATARVS
jgi:hypothetical protein